MSIEELFGTLQQSFVETWRKHLKTPKYSAHKALNDFYDDIPDLVDQLIEDYMGIHGKVENYKNILDAEHEDEVAYLEALRKVCKEGRELLDDSELESDMDSILSLIDSTLYQLKELKEQHKPCSLKDYLYEAFKVNESAASEKLLWKFIDALKLDDKALSKSQYQALMDKKCKKFIDDAEDIVRTFYNLAAELQDISDGEWGSDDNTEYTSWGVVSRGKDFYERVLNGNIDLGASCYEYGENFAYALDDWAAAAED